MLWKSHSFSFYSYSYTNKIKPYSSSNGFKFLSYYKFSSLAHLKCIQSFVKLKVNLCKIEFLLLMLKKPKNANMPKNDLT